MPRKNKSDVETFINGIDLTALKFHPRIVELRIIGIFNILANEYGVNETTEYLKNMCFLMRVEWSKISAILNSQYQIRALEKRDLRRFRQEVITAGLSWGESRWYTAQTYLNISHTTLYTKANMLKPELYVSHSWIQELNNNVTICGHEAFKLEALRFMEGLSRFLGVMGNVSIPASQL